MGDVGQGVRVELGGCGVWHIGKWVGRKCAVAPTSASAVKFHLWLCLLFITLSHINKWKGVEWCWCECCGGCWQPESRDREEKSTVSYMTVPYCMCCYIGSTTHLLGIANASVEVKCLVLMETSLHLCIPNLLTTSLSFLYSDSSCYNLTLPHRFGLVFSGYDS